MPCLKRFGYYILLQLFVWKWGTPQHQNPHYSGKIKPSIAYGGVLNKKLATSSNNSDIIRAVQFGLDYAKKRLPHAIPLNENGKIHSQFLVSSPKKLKLIYSSDGLHPVSMRFRQGDGSVKDQPLVWGYTYCFSLSWELSISSWQHNFVITHYWDDKLYIFTHTFHKRDHVSRNNLADSDLPSLEPRSSTIHSVVFDQDSSSSASSSSISYSSHLKTTSPSCRSSANPFTQLAQCHKDERYFLPQSIYSEQLNSVSEEKLSQDSGVFRLKILTYNIWNFNSLVEGKIGYAKRIKRLAKACISIDADIISFQEVRFEDGGHQKLGPNQVQHLADLLPKYQFIYQPAQIQTHGLPKRIEEGLAIFSKYPIVSHEYLLLTRNSNDNADGHQRILLHAAVKLPTSDVVHIFNTHLSLSHLARAVSVVEIWKHMQKFDGPAFLMGDFNAEAHNREVEFLAGEEGIDGLWTKSFRDSWKVKFGIKHLGYTYNTLEDELTKRIDLIFFRELPNVSLEDITLLDNGARGNEAASDHLGLLGTYLIKNYK